ncbi:MAG TPA: hypothetical protein VE326_13370 [Candidatus Binatia bacterium]|nr:hypothetical protein [Candidatus Binatia bacterium]
MATDAPASAPSLPPMGAYLRSLFALGRRSIPPALPALVFLWFYHFGTALYLELAGGGTSPLGYRDNDALMIHALMKVSAYLPLLALVYTPFLPLQDALLHGERRSFVSAIRHVLERMVPFVLSVILQILVVAGPIVLIAGILVAAIAPFPDLPKEIVAVIAVAAVIPLLIWLMLSGFFLIFAIPGVVLSGLGATRSVSASARLVGSHFGGLLVRLIVFFVILFLIVLVATIPAMLLGTIAAWATHADRVFRILSILWTSLVSALTFPFWVAAVLVLYRALVPAGAVEGVPEAVIDAAPGPLRPQGEHPTPFSFE